MTTNVALLLLLGVLLFFITVTLRRHQRLHCAHLHALSEAVVALAAVVDIHHPGELPPVVAEFIAWYRDPDNADDELPQEDKVNV